MRQKLIIAISSILLAFVLLELFARLFVGVETLPEIKSMRLDPVLGWRWTPNYQGTYIYRGYSHQLTISRQGLRNEMVTIPKPPGQQRIIAVGDSITAGWGVEQEDTFVKRLQESLGIEVVNAGVGDYGTEQELLWLKRNGLELEPDLVILGVYLNDSRPFPTSPKWVTVLNNMLLNRSAFYTYYYQLIVQQRAQQSEQDTGFRYRYREPWEAGHWKTDTEALIKVIEGGSDDFGLAWEQSENEKIQQGIAEIATLGNEHNFELFLVIFPVSIQVETQAELPELDQPQRWLADFAEAEGIAYLDLLPILQQRADEELYIDQAHLTPHGHAVVAEALQNALAELR